jgi:hypothetical protein
MAKWSITIGSLAEAIKRKDKLSASPRDKNLKKIMKTPKPRLQAIN